MFIQQLKNPQTYQLPNNSLINIIQTHISFVVLTEKFAYKVKKPVNFGFLDFSTLNKRKQYCEEELRLNSRLCPQIYEEVVTFTETSDGNHIEINGSGPIVEYAVKMNQFSQENIMMDLLKKKIITKDHLNELVSSLVRFYSSSKKSEEISSYGSIDSIKQNIDENFEQTFNKIGLTITKDKFEYIKQANEEFFTYKKDDVVKRKENGFIKSCHGDLHSGNIVLLNDSLCVFDCIEFNKRFRYIDVASDIGFFAMDLDFRGFPYLSSYLITQYIKKSNDKTILTVLNIYKSYRAYVRGKVLGFQLDDLHIEESRKQMLLKEISMYFDLSSYYASLMNIQVNLQNPIIFMMSGLTGTGKSTVAEKISIDYDAAVINTDIVRKEDAGMDKFERHLDNPNQGLYSPEKVHVTYEKVIEKARSELKKGNNVVLDATFQKQEHRIMVKQLSQEFDAVFIPVFCTCPESVAKEWLDERLKSKSVSDGRWEIYQLQKETFDMFTDDEQPVIIDTSESKFTNQLAMFSSILERIEKE